MFFYLLILFTALPAVELILIIEVGSRIGALNTLALILFTGVSGAALARWQGFLTLQRIQQALNQGVMPNAELMDGALILIGGVALLTPGFVTDFFGLLCLFPPTRHLLKGLLQRYFTHMVQEGRSVHIIRTPPRDEYDDIDI